MRHISYSWLILLLILSACGSHSSSRMACESFLLLQNKIGETFTSEEFRNWVREQYALRGPAEIEIKNYSDLNADFVWQANGFQYSAALEEGEFTWLRIDKKGGGKIGMQDIFACFGDPESYRALHGLAIDAGDYQELDLFFPDIGILAHGYRHYSSNSHSTMSIKENFPILYLRVTSPGTMEELLKQVYGETAPYEYGAIRPWPNDWENIVIDVTPQIQRLQSAP